MRLLLFPTTVDTSRLEFRHSNLPRRRCARLRLCSQLLPDSVCSCSVLDHEIAQPQAPPFLHADTNPFSTNILQHITVRGNPTAELQFSHSPPPARKQTPGATVLSPLSQDQNASGIYSRVLTEASGDWFISTEKMHSVGCSLWFARRRKCLRLMLTGHNLETRGCTKTLTLRLQPFGSGIGVIWVCRHCIWMLIKAVAPTCELSVRKTVLFFSCIAE